MRICSLLPSATEIVADLGLVDSLVAVSEESSYCSPSRDACYGVFNRGDKVVRGITRAARHFGAPRCALGCSDAAAPSTRCAAVPSRCSGTAARRWAGP
jgi:hypothetical protein